MTRDIFAQRVDVLATAGNFNNEIGLPLTLLNLAPVHEWAVVEMGMKSPGRNQPPVRHCPPGYCCDHQHLGRPSGKGLETLDNVAHAKSEIFEGMQDESTALIFMDDPRRSIMAAHARANTKIAHVRFFRPVRPCRHPGSQY